MDTIGAGLCSFCSYGFTAAVLYPYRDYAKLVTNHNLFPVNDPVAFAVSRYKGMFANPSIPAVIAGPPTALYTAFVGTKRLTGSDMLAGMVAGTSHAAAKRAVKVFSNRMQKVDHRDRAEFPSPMDALRKGTQRHGAFSWVQGFSPLVVPHILWYGLPMVMLSRFRNDGPRGRSFTRDVWTAFSLHSFCGFISVPFRNVFRSVLAKTDYNHLNSFTALVENEKALYHEAYVVGSRMLREAGPLYFFSGNFKTMFVTSLPWAIGFATYRKVGGPL